MENFKSRILPQWIKSMEAVLSGHIKTHLASKTEELQLIFIAGKLTSPELFLPFGFFILSLVPTRI
jgi:hypothetical protein